MLALAAGMIGAASSARAVDVSQPAMLQMFEAKWDTIEDRMADIFQVGYGQMWAPPPERADQGNLSVGYDVFDRFDLGKPRNETLYGTETSLKTFVDAAHNASVKVYTDFVPNHNGFGKPSDATFVAQGGYPGFVFSAPGKPLGDFHDPSISYQQDTINGSLLGLIDIAQEENIPLIRQPVAAGNPDNIPAGTLYNKPDPNNARFYVDTASPGVTLTDPALGGLLYAAPVQPGRPAGRRPRNGKRHRPVDAQHAVDDPDGRRRRLPHRRGAAHAHVAVQLLRQRGVSR